MANILVLTHIYPGAGTPSRYTSVVHYFAKEWVKRGNRVTVIHTNSYFPRVYYSILNTFKKQISKRFNFVLPEKRIKDDIIYEIDGVKVFRKCLYKIKPSGIYSKRALEDEVKQVQDFLNSENFSPDYIISHWVNPQLYLSHRFKELYHAKTALVLHDYGKKIQEFPHWRDLFDSVDVWGYRSFSVQQGFESIFGEQKRSFKCNSGIPSTMLEGRKPRDWEQCNNYIYVGTLIERKYPNVIIDALNKMYSHHEYCLYMIGDGSMMENLQKQIEQNNQTAEVELLGRKERKDIVAYLDKADVFVMISKNEVFGLVYLEAMARGCIVVASENEGMQGIITHGENGFLCPAGDEMSLISVLSHISSLSSNERLKISDAAVMTACKYTDEKAAESYLFNVITL